MKKVYFRNEAGEFITAREWFSKSRAIRIEANNSFLHAESHLTSLRDICLKMKNSSTLAILGANEVNEYANTERSKTMAEIYINESGYCTLYYHSSVTRGSREERLKRFLDAIDNVVLIQEEYAKRAASGYVEVEE